MDRTYVPGFADIKLLTDIEVDQSVYPMLSQILGESCGEPLFLVMVETMVS